MARREDEEALDEAAARGPEQAQDNGCAPALLAGNPRLEVVYSFGIGCRIRYCRVRVEEVRRGPP